MIVMNNLICIVGPTATGKTKLAKEIKYKIEHFNNRTIEQSGKAELISIDSRQVYIGMDIGTGKDAKIFGTDLVQPEKLFNVSDFVKIIRPKIEELWRQDILPILVGGTGLYLRAVIDGIETMEIPPDEELRKKYEKYSVEELQEKLKELDSRFREDDSKVKLINNSDWNNPRRLIRRIEILNFYSVGDDLPVVPMGQTRRSVPTLKIDRLLMIGLPAPLPKITKNIEKRVQERLDQGLLEEIKKLVKRYGWNEVLRNTIAYKEWEEFFSGKITQEDAIKNWTKDEIDYAKRQITWFKKDMRIKWFESTDINLLQKSLELINSNLR
jgi:tRNA dimethylallyltransferase